MRIIGNNPAADNAEITAVASGTLPDGKAVVVNTDGTVSVVGTNTVSPNYSYGSTTATSGQASQYTHVSADPFNSNRWAMTWTDDVGTKYVRLLIITRSGSSLTFSSISNVYTGGNASAPYAVWDVVTTNKILMVYSNVYNRGTARVCTLSGSAGSESFSYGTEYTFSNISPVAGGSTDAGATPPVAIGTTGSYLFTYRKSSDGYTYSQILRINGTTVTRSNNGGSNGNILISANLSSAGQVAINPTDPTKGFMTVVNASEKWVMYPLTLSGSGDAMAVSVGSEQVVTPNIRTDGNGYLNAGGFQRIQYIDGERFLIFAKGGDSPHNKKIVSIMVKYVGTTYTGGGTSSSSPTYLPQNISGTSNNPEGFMVSNNIVTDPTTFTTIAKFENMNPRQVVVSIGTVNTGTGAITYANQTRIDDNVSNTAAYYLNCPQQSGTDQATLTSWAIDGQIPYVRLMLSGSNILNLTSENFIGFADGAAADTGPARVQVGSGINGAQSSLTIGQQYFVQTDGTIGLTAADPSVIAGTAISATEIIVKG
mgnify:CR=1 FL=1